MPESSIVVQPEPTGSGSYTAASRLQAAGLQSAIAVFERAAAAVPIPSPPQPIVIADYGAATGHNSLLPIGAAIAVLRKRTRPEHSVLVAHTDVADNDFTALFRTLERGSGHLSAQGPRDLRLGGGPVVLSQILPSNSVNLGWSSWAIQWLSRVPAVIDDHLRWPTAPTIRCAPPTPSKLRRTGTSSSRSVAGSWSRWPPGRDDDGRRRRRRVRLPAAAVGDDGRTCGAGGGRVDHRRRSVQDVRPHRRTARRRLRAPFAPNGRFERLEIEHLEVFDAADRFWERTGSTVTQALSVQRWAGFARASVFPTLSTALAGGAADPGPPSCAIGSKPASPSGWRSARADADPAGARRVDEAPQHLTAVPRSSRLPGCGWAHNDFRWPVGIQRQYRRA